MVSLIDKFKTLLTFDFKTLSALLSQKYSGYLVDVGWFNSFKSKTAVDKNNNPILWMTYPFSDFIKDRLNNSLTVFEFGSGNSTLYLSKMVRNVISVEHNKQWYNRLVKTLPDNVEVIYRDVAENESYEKSCLEFNKSYDIIFVDGQKRNECISHGIKALSNNGIIILDDSERSEYRDGIKLLEENYFKRIDFWGIAPGILFKKCTTIFYKSHNCLGI